jgi:type VI secretion system secreted protein Hcp
MAVDMFLKIETVTGESVDHKHAGEIDVISWSWGMSQSGSTHVGSGGGSGKVSVQDVTFTKYVDKATTALMQACCTGKHFPKATLTVRKAGEKPLEYLVITFNDLIVSSISTGGSGGEDRITENLALNFASFKVEYKAQKKDGSGEAATTVAFDVAKNTLL